MADERDLAGDADASQAFPRPVKARRRAPRRKKRRWRRIAIAVLVLLILSAWSLPYVLSTGMVTRFLTTQISNRIKGNVAIGDLSLSWLGECRVTGLRLTDGADREVLNAATIVYGRGLWHALPDLERFEQFSLVDPQVALILDAETLVGESMPQEGSEALATD